MQMIQRRYIEDHAFRHIMLATDFSAASQAAFCESVSLCAVSKARLEILHVQQTLPGISLQDGSDPDSLTKVASRALGEWQELAQAAGVACKVSLERGSPSQIILQKLLVEPVDLVVLGTKALHGFEHLVFGSTAEQVVSQAPCPVLAAGPQARPLAANAGPIVFATDFHQTTAQALRYAASLAEALKVPLHCIHVLPRALADKATDRSVAEIMTSALQELTRDLMDTAATVPVCNVLYGSDISHTIVHYAQVHGARLIVLGLRRASLVASSVPVHIAYRVITEAPCPTVTASFTKDIQSCIGANLRP